MKQHLEAIVLAWTLGCNDPTQRAPQREGGVTCAPTGTPTCSDGTLSNGVDADGCPTQFCTCPEDFVYEAGACRYGPILDLLGCRYDVGGICLLDFGRVELAATARRILTLWNTGEATLHV